jgi:preprotein translocase SecE subunit
MSKHSKKGKVDSAGKTKTIEDEVKTPQQENKTTKPKIEKTDISKDSKSKVLSNKSSAKGKVSKIVYELKQVNWPSFRYVARWSGIIIIFTLVLGSALGFVDYYSASAIKLIDCTSPVGGKSRPINECLQQLSTDLTFRDFANQVTAPQLQVPRDTANDPNVTLPIEEPALETEPAPVNP